MLGHPCPQIVRSIPHVRPDNLYLIEELTHHAKQVRSRRRVFDVRGVDKGTQQKTGRIHENVAFSAANLLRPIVAVNPPFSVVFTDCESMMAAEGWTLRDIRVRTSSRS